MESKREHGNVFLTMPENMKDWSKYNAEITLKVGMIKASTTLTVVGTTIRIPILIFITGQMFWQCIRNGC